MRDSIEEPSLLPKIMKNRGFNYTEPILENMLLAKEKYMYLFISHYLQVKGELSFSMFEWLGYIFFLLANINDIYI